MENKSKQICIPNFGIRLLGFVSVVYELVASFPQKKTEQIR
jgi:hypothetical protein